MFTFQNEAMTYRYFSRSWKNKRGMPQLQTRFSVRGRGGCVPLSLLIYRVSFCVMRAFWNSHNLCVRDNALQRAILFINEHP